MNTHPSTTKDKPSTEYTSQPMLPMLISGLIIEATDVQNVIPAPAQNVPKAETRLQKYMDLPN